MIGSEMSQEEEEEAESSELLKFIICLIRLKLLLAEADTLKMENKLEAEWEGAH
ncbi:unnamed protein product [Brassica rapa]|uniref:Uncharacterized protein n=1 Tax=Brassica campestris TaxID=3711 RepID=A0A3P6BTP5_BRACM|nr:unnamed protein product [Brassica rapa]VDD05748.1 unnamed protein product [Brassica rapa]